MNNEEARRVLLAYRPGTVDEDDPEVAEALDQARRETGLGVWLEQTQAFHETVRAELRRVPVPADLKTRILSQQLRQRKVIVPMWRRPEFLLAAACLVLGLILSGLWFSRSGEDESYAGFRSRMVAFALREYRMDILTKDAAEVRQYLRRKGAPADFALTPGLQTTPVMGGASLSWQGHPVSMVCFSLPQKEILYMFVIDQSALGGQKVPGTRPVLEPAKSLMTASWSNRGKVYLIAAAATAPALEKKAPPAG